MIKIKEYRRVQTLEEAYALNQKRGNRVLGGMLWLKMSHNPVDVAIDLSSIDGLASIEETDTAFRIGCMATLRQLELYHGFNEYTAGAAEACLRPIVGTQFRNMATVGGSVFGRFGFSDVITLFLALNTYVELYHAGIVPLSDFVNQKRDRDLLVRVIVNKIPLRCAYLSYRNTKTDFPVLTCAASRTASGTVAVFGARPGIARVVPIDQSDVDGAVESVPMGSNMRGSAAYRTHLAKVLVKRGLEQL